MRSVINKYDFFIFDCDGVILNSNKLKSEAFSESLFDEPFSLVSEFVEYHKKNGGISRYEKFRYYFEEMKNSTHPKEEAIVAIERFSLIVKKGLLECDFVPGILKFLKNVKDTNKISFVVSGSDEEELKEVFFQREIQHYFVRILGSPASKYENTNIVYELMDINRKGVFFGDSKSDFIAAKQYGMDFIFVKELSEWKDGEKINIKEGNLIINNFTDLIL
jgi:phosphoglycolate phosphatase-like HAD superfamily hydrolase